MRLTVMAIVIETLVGIEKVIRTGIRLPPPQQYNEAKFVEDDQKRFQMAVQI
jgi:hypothetical protein